MTGRERELPAAGPSGGALSVGQGARVGVSQGGSPRQGQGPAQGESRGRARSALVTLQILRHGKSRAAGSWRAGLSSGKTTL